MNDKELTLSFKALKMKPEDKLKTFEPEIQDLYNQVNIELDEKYTVSGLEAKLTGIDILAIQNMWVKHLKENNVWNQNCANIISYRINSAMPKYTPCLIFKKA